MNISAIEIDVDGEKFLNEAICPFCERELYGELFTLEERNGGAASCRHCNLTFHWICDPFSYDVFETEE